MKNLISPNYWFMLDPGQHTSFMLGSFAVITILFLLATIALIYLKRKNQKNLYFKTLDKLYFFSLTNFIISLFLLFFAYESVPFFSSRFWYILWIIGIGAWLYFILTHMSTLPERKLTLQKEKEFRKYIP